MVSIKATGDLSVRQYTELEDRLTRLFEKILRGAYLLDEFKSSERAVSIHKEYFDWADRFSQHLVDIEDYYRSGNRFYVSKMLEPGRESHLEQCFFYTLNTTSASRLIITASDDSICKSIYERFMNRKGLDNVHFHCLHLAPITRHYFTRVTDGPRVLIATDKYAAEVLRDMDPAVNIAVINYDTAQVGPATLHKATSTWLKDCGELTSLESLQSSLECLERSFDLLLVWQRKQLALKHSAATVIQQHMRSALCRIKTQRDQIAAAERHHAAKTIQVWRRSLVLQRKNRRLGAAALSNPLRERGLPLPPRSRNTVRRHKRREKGRRYLLKNEEGPQESLHDLQQSVQSLQESVNHLEHRNQQLVDTNTLLLRELSAIQVHPAGGSSHQIV